MRINTEYQGLLSNDLSAVAGLMFDVGTGRYPAPHSANDAVAQAACLADVQRVRAESVTSENPRAAQQETDTTQHEMQRWLRDLGLALGFAVGIASNDRSRAYAGGPLGDGCVSMLAADGEAATESVRLIDVFWLRRQTRRMSTAFEVEHSTSIHSGTMRMAELGIRDLPYNEPQQHLQVMARSGSGLKPEVDVSPKL